LLAWLRSSQAQPNTYQTDHIDWGFRVDALYGMDYYSPSTT
jgi:hypothetical protein